MSKKIETNTGGDIESFFFDIFGVFFDVFANFNSVIFLAECIKSVVL